MLKRIDTSVAESLRSKRLYKLFIVTLKYIPMIISSCYILNTILAITRIDFPLLSMLSGLSILTWIFMYLATIVFRFCNYHRMFLWYILLSDTVNTVDYYIDLPINDFNMYAINISLIGIFLFIILYLYVKSRRQNAKRSS